MFAKEVWRLVKKSGLEPYTGKNAVPWNYGIEATTEQGEKIEPEVLLNAFNSLEKPSLLRKNVLPPYSRQDSLKEARVLCRD